MDAEPGATVRMRTRLERERCRARSLGLTVEQFRHRRRAAAVLARLRGVERHPTAPAVDQPRRAG